MTNPTSKEQQTTLTRTIFHYCGTKQFSSIIQNKSLWLTDLYQTNDAREGDEIVYAVCDFLREQGTDKNTIEQWKQNFEQLHNFPQGYGFCMSEEGDLLSQWRGYADDGQGFSIGFDREKMEDLVREKNQNKSYSFLQIEKIEYERIDQKRHFEEFAKHIPRLIEDGALRHHRMPSLLSIEPDQQEKERREKAWNELVHVNMWLGFVKKFCVKNKAFKEEKEWRIIESAMISRRFLNEVKGSFDHLSSQFEFFHRENTIIPYISFDFRDSSMITDVILGPRNKSPHYAISMFLQKHGFSHVSIHDSEAPYL